jgi:hypothetical protein
LVGSFGLAMLLVSGCDRMGGVSSGEERAVRAWIDRHRPAKDREAEGRPQFTRWETAMLEDAGQVQVRVVRAVWKSHQHPEEMDRLFVIEDGEVLYSIDNRFGEEWRSGAEGLDWKNAGP